MNNRNKQWLANTFSSMRNGWLTGGTISVLYGFVSSGLTTSNFFGWFAIAIGTGLLSIPLALFEASAQENEVKKVEEKVKDNHRVCCDCEDPQLHEESLQEVEQYLKQEVKED